MKRLLYDIFDNKNVKRCLNDESLCDTKKLIDDTYQGEKHRGIQFF